MILQSLFQTISHLNSEKQQELLELYKAVQTLYKQNGNRLLEKRILSEIRETYPDLALLIETTEKTVGLYQLDQIVHYLQKINDKEFIDISTHKVGSRVSDVFSHVAPWADIQTHWSDELGIKAISSKGNRYERVLDKDIDKLIR